MTITISDEDRKAASDAMVAGWNACPRNPYRGPLVGPMCLCELNTIDGCQARVEAIATAIAQARQDTTLLAWETSN